MSERLSDFELRRLAASLPEPVFVLDEDGRYIDVIGGADRAKYDDPDGLVGRSLHELFDREQADVFLDMIHTALRVGKLHTSEYALGSADLDREIKASGPTGQQWFEATVTPLDLERDGRRLVLWVAYNATERHQLLNQLKAHRAQLEVQKLELESLALTDEVTGLPNRRHFFTVFRHEFAKVASNRSEHLSLVLLDLDHFKQINDRHGHDCGDAMLRQVALLLEKSRRESDLVARIGGEEFAVLLPEAALEDATRIAHSLLKRIDHHPLQYGDIQVHCTTSIGVAEYHSSDASHGELLKRVDKALYQAKSEGRNRCCVSYAEGRINS